MIKPYKTKIKTITYKFNKDTYLDIKDTGEILRADIWNKKGETEYIISSKKGTITTEDFIILAIETVIKNTPTNFY